MEVGFVIRSLFFNDIYKFSGGDFDMMYNDVDMEFWLWWNGCYEVVVCGFINMRVDLFYRDVGLSFFILCDDFVMVVGYFDWKMVFMKV